MTTWDDILNGQRVRIAGKLAERQAAKRVMDDIVARCEAEKRDLTDAEFAACNAARATIDRLDPELDVLEEDLRAKELRKSRDDAADRLAAEVHPVKETAGVGMNYESRAYVGAEPRTYTKHAAIAEERSFFADMFAAEMRGDYNARDRLARHSAEVRAEGEMTERALATGGLAGLVPPQYLVADYALVLRNGRPVANLIRKEPLPDVGMVFQVPRGTTGASVGVQATENSAVSTTDEVWSNVQLPVCTVAGYSPVSRQSLERGTPGIDSIIFSDLIGAYGAAVDQQVLSGTGASGQVLGILNTAGITQMSAYTAAVTAATFTSKLAGAIAAVASGGTATRPRAIVMHPRRWGWYSTLVDTTGRPLVSTEGAGPFNAAAINAAPGGYSGDIDATGPVGWLQGLPVYTDLNVPTSVGSGPEDQVLVIDTQAAMLFENGDGAPATLAFEQTAATSLTVNLVAYGYIAFTAGRYPTATAVIGGNSGAGFGQVSPVY